MVIIEDSKASIDKQFAVQHKNNMLKMKRMDALKKKMFQQLQDTEGAIEEK